MNSQKQIPPAALGIRDQWMEEGLKWLRSFDPKASDGTAELREIFSIPLRVLIPEIHQMEKKVDRFKEASAKAEEEAQIRVSGNDELLKGEIARLEEVNQQLIAKIEKLKTELSRQVA